MQHEYCTQTLPFGCERRGIGLCRSVFDVAKRRRAVADHGIQLEVVKLPDAQGPREGLVLLPKRWVVERTQSHYLQSALDVQTPPAHDRTHWVAQPARRGEPVAGRSAG